MTKIITLFIAGILAMPYAMARTVGDGVWDCFNETGMPRPTQFMCYSQCAWPGFPPNLSREEFQRLNPRVPTPATWTCTADDVSVYPFGYFDCEPVGPPITCTPRPAPQSGGGSSGTNKALVAGGVVVAGVALWNFLQPEIPVDGLKIQPKANLVYRDGFVSSSMSLQGEYGNFAVGKLQIRPRANFAYRDGFASSSAVLQGEYGNWAFSASSAHTGREWTKPYARVQWAWVF